MMSTGWIILCALLTICIVYIGIFLFYTFIGR